MITTDTIIEYLKNAVEQKLPIAPTVWLDSAVKLNLLLADEQAELFDLEQKVAQLKIDFLQEDDKRNVSKAKMMVEASEEFKEMKNQHAKIDRIIEFIRLAKVQSRISVEEMKGY
jgi:hypothetical protein